MTSDVKSCQSIFLGLHHVFSPRGIGSAGASPRRRLILLLSVDWLPPCGRPSGACLPLGARLLSTPHHAAAGDTPPGRRLFPGPVAHLSARNRSPACVPSSVVLVLGDDGARLSQGPQEAAPRPSHGDRDARGLLPACDTAAGACPPAALRCPTAGLDDWGLVVPAQWQMAADLGRSPIRPGPFAQAAPGRGVAGRGARSLLALCTGSRFGRHQAHTLHALPGPFKACPGSHGGSQGDGPGAVPPPPSRPGLAHRRQPPRGDGLVPCRVEPLEAVVMGAPSSALVLRDAVLTGPGPDHCRAPSPVGRAPLGPAPVPDIVAEHAGGEPPRGGLPSAEGIVTGAGEIAHGVLLHRGALDGGERPGASPPGQWPRVPTVGGDAVTGFSGHQPGGDAPAGVPLLRQSAIASIAPGTGVGDADEMGGLGGHLTEALSHVTWAGANATQGGARGAMILRDISAGTRVFVNGQADAECARRRHGCPPRGMGAGFDI
jgi:hypothetical protein